MDFELVAQVIEAMEGAGPSIGASAIIGFDGFTDTIVRVVRDHAPDRSPQHFGSKRDFGKEIVGLGPDNSSFDLTAVATKMGGNGPNMAHALGKLGLKVDCIGMLGRPDIHGLFRTMDPNCSLHSYADPTQTTALEFDDGKVLLASTDILKTADWPLVRDTIGINRLVELYEKSDIIGFANWAELEHAADIWEGIEREVLSALSERRRIVLFDLADPSRRHRDFDRLSGLIRRLSRNHETVLCLNRNEALAIGRQLSLTITDDLDALGTAIFMQLNVSTLIIRDPHDAIAWSEAGAVHISTFHTPSPRLSTGGGDNFNAGYCFARLSGFDVRSSLLVAAAVAGLYVSQGDSPTRTEVLDFLKAKSRRPAAALSQEAAE